MDFLKYESYRDKYGLVHPTPNTVSQNGIRFTVEAALGSKDADFIMSLKWAIRACLLRPGLLRRYPDSDELEGPDDYYAACCFGYFFDRQLSKDIYAYGLSHGFYFNNTSDNSFNVRALLGRQPAFIAHSKNCAGLSLNLADKLALVAGILLSANDGSQDGFVLTWFIVKAVKGKYWIVDRAIAHWQRALKQKYEHGIGQLLKEYYGHDHPNAEALLDEFGN